VSIRNDVYSALTHGDSPNLSVFPDQADQGAAYPLLVFTFVAGHDEVYLDGYASLSRAVVQVDAWADDPDDVDALMDEASTRMKAATAFSVTAVNATAVAGFEPDTKLYRSSLEFALWFDA
jgi:hypothetical protein